jgi:tRNA U34 5-methylaminomethyl-2-thiouridine-forming methyltransferase MnmC
VAVRRSLSEAGFELELRPGFGGKKSVLAGKKSVQLTAV